MVRNTQALPLFSAILLSWSVAASTSELPNIVFILADDLGYADTGVTGARTIKTPNIDRLAAEGLNMTSAYASSAICSPTRTALLTGNYPHRYAIGLEEPLITRRTAQQEFGVPLDQPTIASVLKDKGYQTALVGKWHLGDTPKHSPLNHGYQYFFGFLQGAADFFRHQMIRDGDDVGHGLIEGRHPVERQGYLTDILGDEALRWLGTAKRQPLFLSLHFNAPHWPWEGRDDESVARQLTSTQHYAGGSLETYREMVEVLDENIGRVLDALEASGISDNTIVIFTSDNGGERFSDTWPHLGVKGELLEGGIRVPLIFRWPERIAPGRVSDQVITTMDFLPTLLTAAGGEVDTATYDGVNLLPQILGDKEAISRTVFWRFKASDQAAVRDGNWKYLRLGGKEHLFNLGVDPRERAALRELHPEKFRNLKKMVAEWEQQMLPYPNESFSEAVKNAYQDRY